jgi:DNA-directed RNA polymerase specialized sigma24 family protein
MNDEQTRTRFETLLLPLMKDAYNLSRWLMKNQEDAEDMVQESYLRAYRFFNTFHEGTNCRALVPARRAKHMLHRTGRS